MSDLQPPVSRFVVSQRFEIFYALNTLLSPTARIHGRWRRETRDRLPPAFFEAFAAIGGAWEIWPVLAATIPKDLAEPTTEAIVAAMRDQEILTFTETIIAGLLHSPAVAAALVRERRPLRPLTLAKALNLIPKAKQEWLGFIGLYPYAADAPMVVTLAALLADPEGFRRTVTHLIEVFWRDAFSHDWRRLEPQLRRSLEEKERLFHACSLQEFFQQALIRVDIDERKGVMTAVRGGYRLSLDAIEHCYFMPSAFNDRRYWSALGEGDRVVAYFPYFDPRLALHAGDEAAVTQPEPDVALIFKALGDSTRFAIASLLARSPQTSVELARLLAVSKPTVSHHVQQLREAGLLTQTYLGGAVRLALNRKTLEDLSALTVLRLFGSGGDLKLSKTRRQHPAPNHPIRR